MTTPSLSTHATKTPAGKSLTNVICQQAGHNEGSSISPSGQGLEYPVPVMGFKKQNPCLLGCHRIRLKCRRDIKLVVVYDLGERSQGRQCDYCPSQVVPLGIGIANMFLGLGKDFSEKERNIRLQNVTYVHGGGAFN